MEEGNNKAEAHTIASAFDDIINELSQEGCYINNRKVELTISSARDIQCPCSCKEFIKQWQNVYGKVGIQISSFIDKIPNKRVVHTVSCFLLGLWCYDKSDILSNRLDNQLKDFPQDTSLGAREAFMFAWMLTCIYHDFGYAYEEGGEVFTPDANERISLVKESQPCDRYIPKFSMDYMEKYMEYRHCRFGRKDHGIYGAKKLMQDLHNNEFLDYYKLAAQTIACHNMYYCVKDDEFEKCYQTKGMTELIREDADDKRRDYRKHPFLFLLSLVDTIEPTKAFNNYNAIFDIQINLEKEHDGAEKLIVIPQNGSDEEHLNKYKNALHEMDKWLTAVETGKNENGFKISLES